MKHGYRASLLTLSIALFSGVAFAEPHYGATFSLPVVTKEPSPLRGFQFMLNYDPDMYHWRQFNVYIDGGYSHFSQNQEPYYSTISIYSLAPVVRYTFHKHGPFLPYFELSIGVAYLNHTHIENRNLGIHFSFQDRLGLGTLLGSAEKFSIGLHAVHYSNSHLSSHNSGISIPVMLDLGYRFS